MFTVNYNIDEKNNTERVINSDMKVSLQEAYLNLKSLKRTFIQERKTIT